MPASRGEYLAVLDPFQPHRLDVRDPQPFQRPALHHFDQPPPVLLGQGSAGHLVYQQQRRRGPPVQFRHDGVPVGDGILERGLAGDLRLQPERVRGKHDLEGRLGHRDDSIGRGWAMLYP
jgi:hypothetical protein